MKKMDSLGLKTCSFQAKLFEASQTQTSCSSKIFIRRFMNSELAKRMDSGGLMFEALEVAEALNEVEMQYGNSTYGKDKFTTDELYWIGYIYRYWAYVTGKSSKQIYKIIKPDQLRSVYYPYHSLDPLQAIERIQEGSSLMVKESYDDIAKGVIALRKVRNRRNNLE